MFIFEFLFIYILKVLTNIIIDFQILNWYQFSCIFQIWIDVISIVFFIFLLIFSACKRSTDIFTYGDGDYHYHVDWNGDVLSWHTTPEGFRASLAFLLLLIVWLQSFWMPRENGQQLLESSPTLVVHHITHVLWRSSEV